jgi:hypothetical protein
MIETPLITRFVQMTQPSEAPFFTNDIIGLAKVVIVILAPIFGLVIWFLRYGPNDAIRTMRGDLNGYGERLNRVEVERAPINKRLGNWWSAWQQVSRTDKDCMVTWCAWRRAWGPTSAHREESASHPRRGAQNRIAGGVAGGESGRREGAAGWLGTHCRPDGEARRAARRAAMSALDRIPYTPLLHVVALVATVATIIADFVISLRNMQINQANWDKFHDFLPFLYLWAGGQFAAKRWSAWKPSDVPADTPPVDTTRSEARKTPSAGQPAQEAP